MVHLEGHRGNVSTLGAHWVRQANFQRPLSHLQPFGSMCLYGIFWPRLAQLDLGTLRWACAGRTPGKRSISGCNMRATVPRGH